MSKEDALRQVEAELQKQGAELSGGLLDVCRYAMEGGRRTRAMLLLEAAEDLSGRAVQAAAALEILHAATLLQDDIFDSGMLRRGRPAAHMQFGRALTILASDWLLLRSLELAADFDPRFFRQLACAGRAMVQAEAKELERPMQHCPAQAEQYSRDVAQGKTGTLFCAALCAAAVLRGMPADRVRAWEQLGMETGLTYQMVDDCLDVYCSEKTLSKTAELDFTNGCVTLPVLLAIAFLKKGGIDLPLSAVSKDRLEAQQILLLRQALHTREIKTELHARLMQRFREHRGDADAAGISSAAMNTFLGDLEGKLTFCFSAVDEGPDGSTAAQPATEPGLAEPQCS